MRITAGSGAGVFTCIDGDTGALLEGVTMVDTDTNEWHQDEVDARGNYVLDGNTVRQLKHKARRIVVVQLINLIRIYKA